VHYCRNVEAAQSTLAEVQKLGSSGMLVQADVSQPEEIRRNSFRD
jgi:hypothetical protein